jgi:phospholipid/cholesterol/gamma-HCH transport system substrate-binding protein
MTGTYLRNGLFVLAFILSIAYLSVNVGALRVPWEPKGQTVQVLLPDTAGLEEGAAVRIAGVRKGSVRRVELVNGQALVTMILDEDVKIYAGTKTMIGSMGLMGEKFLDLRLGSSENEVVKQGELLEGESPASIDQLIATLNEVGKDVRRVTETLSLVLGGQEGQVSIQNIVSHIENLSANLDKTVSQSGEDFSATVKNIRGLTEDLRSFVAANQTSAGRAVENFEVLSDDLRTQLPEVTRRLDDILAKLGGLVEENRTQIESTVSNVNRASERLDGTMASIQSVAAKIDAGEGTIGQLINDDQTANKINSTLTELEGTLAGAREMLGTIQRFRTDIGYRGDYLWEPGDLKSYVTLRLYPREDKFFMVDLVSSPASTAKTRTITREVHSSTSGSEYIVEKRTVEEDDFKFSVQAAKRFSNLTLRGGLIENKAGFGADYDFLDGRLRLELDAYDFGDDDFDPHVKFGGLFFITPNIYVQGGYDDFLNKDRDAAFFGAGFRYTDEDLKYLLGGVTSFVGF